MKRLICRLIGHDFEPEAAHYYGLYSCRRCGYEDRDGRPPSWLEVVRYRLRGWIRDRRHDFRKWWKCSDCGRHFGRHDETVDHLPF